MFYRSLLNLTSTKKKLKVQVYNKKHLKNFFTKKMIFMLFFCLLIISIFIVIYIKIKSVLLNVFIIALLKTKKNR